MAKLFFNAETGATAATFDTVTFLHTGKKHASKIFNYSDGEWVKGDSYTSGTHFKAFIRKVKDLQDFGGLLKKVKDTPAFFIHGEVIPGVDTNQNITRRYREKLGKPATLQTRDLTIVAFDIDGWVAEKGEECTPEYFLEHHMPLEFSQADHIVQYSSSHGITTTPNELKCHFWFWLDTPVPLEAMATWANAYNKKKAADQAAKGCVHPWEKVVDRAIYTPTQPIYTQKRICNGAPDPVPEDQLLYYVGKGQPTLKWHPGVMDTPKKKKKTSTGGGGGNLLGMGIGGVVSDEEPSTQETGGEGGNLQGLEIPQGFDFATATKELTEGVEIHTNVNAIAMALLNDDMPMQRVIDMIRGLMESIGTKDDRWQERYDDIERSVATAEEIVKAGTLTWVEFTTWVVDSNDDELRLGFARKIIEFDEVQVEMGVDMVADTLGVGKGAVKKMLNRALTDRDDERRARYAAMSKSEREASGVAEIELTSTNNGKVLKFIGKTLSVSKKKPELFRFGSGSIVKIVNSQALTPAQMMTDNAIIKNGGIIPARPKLHTVTDDLGEMRALVEDNVVLTNDKGLPVPCPDQILRSIPTLEPEHAPFKRLTGIIEHPYMNIEFKAKKRSGYDDNTGLYMVIKEGSLKLKPMKSPQEAYHYLAYTVFDEFPFDTELDRACAVGMLLTALQRPIVSGDTGMPGFAMISPKPSSGKTTLVQLVHHAVYGKGVAATTWADKDEEMGKAILSILSTGSACVLFDNIPKGSSLKSNELAKAMTSSVYSGRILGGNNIGEYPSNCLWAFTGNNIKLTGDYSTRVLPCMIVPDMSNPETRKFTRGDIGDWVARNRSKILSAALTIIMGGASIKGNPTENSCRFKEWDRMVRLPLWKASGMDLTELFKKSAAQNNAGGSLFEMMEQLVKAFGSDTPIKSKDVWGMMSGIGVSGNLDVSGEELKEAVENVFGGEIKTQQMLQNKLAGVVNDVQGGLKLIKKVIDNQAFWVVIRNRDKINEDVQSKR